MTTNRSARDNIVSGDGVHLLIIISIDYLLKIRPYSENLIRYRQKSFRRFYVVYMGDFSRQDRFPGPTCQYVLAHGNAVFSSTFHAGFDSQPVP